MVTRSIDSYAKTYTERYGMALVPLKPNQKLPALNDWGNHTLSDPMEAQAYWQAHSTQGIGMELGRSGFCSLDIDCAESFATLMDD